MIKISIFTFLFLLLIACSAGQKKSKPKQAKAASDIFKTYKQNCARCHGLDGTAGLSGATNLQTSKLTIRQIKRIIKTGKNKMPAFPQFSDAHTDSLAVFIKNIQK